MGGFGSGSSYHWWRGSKKDTVEDCRQIDANRWMREGILKAGVRCSGTWAWFRNASKTEPTASISYEVSTVDPADAWLRLFYTLTRTQLHMDYRIPLTTTRLRLGGIRWWFVCPLVVNGRECRRRVGKLYLAPGSNYFGCRQCHRLTYTSCQESRKLDRVFRLMAKDLGRDFDDVKRGMRRIFKGR
jgi:hypothetical protein